MRQSERPHARREAQISARNPEELAAQLGRLPSGLAAFERLTPEQITLLSDAIDATRQRRRREIAASFEDLIPPAPLRLPLLKLLRRTGR